MAALPRSKTKTPLTNRNNASAASIDVPYKLPEGRCNFTNLSAGGSDPPRCQCRQFWPKSHCVGENALGIRTVANDEQVGWCMCEHHACYHDVSSDFEVSRQVMTENNGRTRSAPMLNAHEKSQPSTTRGSEYSMPGHEGPRSFNSQSYSRRRRHDSDLADTYADSDRGPGPVQADLPPIPAECLLPLDISSGGFIGDSEAFRELIEYDQHVASHDDPDQDHFGSKIDGTSTPNANRPPDSSAWSLTNVMTPSVRGSPEVGQSGFDYQYASLQAAVEKLASQEPQSARTPRVSQAQSSLAVPITALAKQANSRQASHSDLSTRFNETVAHLRTLLQHFSVYPTLSERTENHARRIDLLENASFSNGAIEELKELIESVEERLRDTDSKVDDIEKQNRTVNDTGSLRGGVKTNDNNSVISETSSGLLSTVIDPKSVLSRLEALETKLLACQPSLLPSRSSPWELEVIFLPFGSSLKGIWSTYDHVMTERSRQTSAAPPESSYHTQTARGQLLLESAKQSRQRWEDVIQSDGIADDWLVARACAQGSKIEERLQSRGFVQTIQIKGPDARDLKAAIVTAFSALPEQPESSSSPRSGPKPKSIRESYHGLQSSWIPLRKVYKDSILGFLDPSEMVTPALWNYNFLMSSVVMRSSGLKRLYVTSSQGYVQSPFASGDWTWQKLRELPRVYPSESSGEVGEADALEPCWDWDARYDPPQPSSQASASFTSQHSSLSIRQVHADQEMHTVFQNQSTRQEEQRSSMSSVQYAQLPRSPLKERRPVHWRTSSMPILTLPLKSSPNQAPAKRRIASYDQDAQVPYSNSPRSSPTGLRHLENSSHTNLILTASKRQRVSRSPSRPRDTPRWSAGPPSPYTDELGMQGERKRGTTPFAYATPHSNTPYFDPRPQGFRGVLGDGDDDGLESDGDVDFEDDSDLEDQEFETNMDVEEEYDQDHAQSQPGNFLQRALEKEMLIEEERAMKMESGQDDVWEGVEEDANSSDADDEDDAEQKALSEYSDDENDEKENHDDDGSEEDDEESDVSSQPSEYPSTQQGVGSTTGLQVARSRPKESFYIHVDEDIDGVEME